MSAVRVVLWESLPNNRGVAVQDVTCAECMYFHRYSDPAQGPFGICAALHGEDVASSFGCKSWQPRSGIGDDEGTP